MLPPGTVPVYVTTPPVVEALTPSFGDVSGGAIIQLVGSHFDDSVTCVFGGARDVGRVVSATLVYCVSPPGTLGSVVVEVEASRSVTSSSGLEFVYMTVKKPMLESVMPTSGANTGSTVVTAIGQHFMPSMSRCVFNGSVGGDTGALVILDGVRDSRHTSLGPVLVGVIESGDATGIGAATYVYEDAMIVSAVVPTVMHAGKSSTITVKGSGFKRSSGA